MSKITLFVVVLAANLLSGCAANVILNDKTPGAEIIPGVATSFEKKERKIGAGTDLVENSALALTSTTAGGVASLAFAMFNRVRSGPYMEMGFQPDDGSKELLLPLPMRSVKTLQITPGDRIKIIRLDDNTTVYNLSLIERFNNQKKQAAK